jgi:hypothetical protein
MAAEHGQEVGLGDRTEAGFQEVTDLGNDERGHTERATCGAEQLGRRSVPVVGSINMSA